MLFERERLYNPECTHENRLPPRATSVPALHRGVYYKNRLDSELIRDLNGEYTFCYKEKDELPDFYTMEYCDSNWDILTVPSMWQYHGYSTPLYPNVAYPIPLVPPYVGNVNPVGYYRKHFQTHIGGRRILYFGGVDCAFFVYLNGQYVGFSKGSRVPAEFDVTELIREGDNLLAVKVFTYSDGTYLENQDMLLASGIFRDVMLYTLHNTYVWDYYIRTEGDTVFTEVTLGGEIPADASVRVTVDGITRTSNAQGIVSFQTKIKNPVRWNAEQPYTYDVAIELYNGTTLLEVHSKKIGFAEYAVEGNRLLLNGRPITIKGINRHEHDPQNGRAITVERIEKELRLIKDHNMNAIRCAHYPNNPAFYEIATELGIYVMDEADLETHGAHVTGDLGYFSKIPLWYKAFFDRVSRMYERDKNETCISIWTLGNENGDGENLHKCFEYLKSKSLKKPVMHTGDDSVNPVMSDFRECGYFTMAELTGFPDEGKPVMMLEYGHAMGNSPGLMKDTWDYVYHHRHVCGGYVWEFKNHGFYNCDTEGNVFYQYGGDFGDLVHWSNFTMDGYCLSDGTPKPSMTECKNVLAPTYITVENGQIVLMNTNDFRPLDYVTLRWEIAEDYTPIRSGDKNLPPVAPYERVILDLDQHIEHPVAGAEYFVNLRFYDDNGAEIANKQVSLGILLPREAYQPAASHLYVEKSGDDLLLIGDAAKIGFTGGLLSYLERDGRILLNEVMHLNLYRAPTDNDGIVNFAARWIGEWDGGLYRHFDFMLQEMQTDRQSNGSVIVKAKGKWAPISHYRGFDIEICYTVSSDGSILVDIHGSPYGRFANALPRIGVAFTLERSLSDVQWYGRGEDECYCDRHEHCNVGLYRKSVEDMNFLYDVPQECGTRIDTRFLSVSDDEKALSVVGSDMFTFSYHDFTMSDLIAARHRNELKKSTKNYLYIDYAMRGLGSKSCGPDPEECYELRPHEFRLAFMIVPGANEKALLGLSRKKFDAVTERLSETYTYEFKNVHVNAVDCIRE